MSADGRRVTAPELTDQQRLAIAARGASVALSAGAGCGKTFVLTERFLAELQPDAAAERSRLGQLLAITFTERAAREMRDRIRAACRRRLLECPPPQADYWLALIRDLDSARINTIHAFCASLLRGHAVEAGVDPRFRVLDGAQSGAMLFALTDELLRDRLAERDEPTLRLVTRFGLDRLRTMLDRLLAIRQEIDWPAWRGETPAGLAARWEKFWRADAVPRLMRRVVESPAAKTLLDVSLRHPPTPPKMRARCDFLLGAIPKLPGSARPAEDLAAIREAARVQGGATKTSWGNAAAFERFRDAAGQLRDAIDDAQRQLRFDTPAALPTAQMALELLALAADLSARYEQKKCELVVLDFSDLLIRGRDLLTGPERAGLRKRLAAQIRLLLVDEFQDTDPLQVETIKALCDNEHLRGKLFFVGDHKQSIYRFRGARPDVFRQLRREIPPAGRLPLSVNFRSRPEVLAFVNALFADELGPDYEPLVAHRPPVGAAPAVEFLWAGDDRKAAADDDAEPARTGSSETTTMGRQERLRRREAEWIARRVRALLDGGEPIVCDKGATSGRPPQPGDIALLFRALTDVEYYEDALQRYGVDYYLVGGHAFYAQQEIYDVLNLLRTIDSRCDAVSLVGALRSPMFGLLDESLLWLAQHPDGVLGGLFDPRLPEELDPQQRQRAERAAAVIGRLRDLKDRLPVARLIGQALEMTGYDAALVAEFLGARKLANLQKLIDQARGFDQAGIFTLSDFISQLAEFVVRQPDEALAAVHPESADVVRLMSIHQSKGLEFPVVIVPDLGRPRRTTGPAAAFTSALGPMLKDADATTGYDLFMAAENDEDLEEIKRLLYVAATRAADYLILSAGVEELGKPVGPWMELLARHFDLTNGEVRGAESVASGQWPVVSKAEITGRSPQSPIPNPLVKVTLEEPPLRSRPKDLRQRRDLMKVVEKARQMAAEGGGRRPPYLAPVSDDPAARRQYSFSRLSGTLHAPAAETDAPAWRVESEADAPPDVRRLGTLVHDALAQVDFRRPEQAAELVRRLADEHGGGSTAVSQLLDEPLEMVERFLASPRGEAIAAAAEVHRELEFLLAWPPDGEPLGERYLRGYIDCLYRDADGRWRLVDYKTNRVSADNLAAVAARYEMQMLLYALAVEKIIKAPPAELTLCFLRPGLEHRFVWDAAARRRVAELIDEALL